MDIINDVVLLVNIILIRFELSCSGFFFDRDTHSCILLPYTGGRSDSKIACRRSSLEFHRRHRCLGE